jgi:hypothetical protein
VDSKKHIAIYLSLERLHTASTHLRGQLQSSHIPRLLLDVTHNLDFHHPTERNRVVACLQPALQTSWLGPRNQPTST